jgi:hypothetical protein
MGTIFKVLLKLIYPFMPKMTKGKLLNVNKTSIKDYIAEDQLPTEIGGSSSTSLADSLSSLKF